VVRPHNLRRPYYEPLVWFMIIIPNENYVYKKRKTVTVDSGTKQSEWLLVDKLLNLTESGNGKD